MKRVLFLIAIVALVAVSVHGVDLKHILPAGTVVAMAIPVKDAVAAAKKYVARGSAAGADYAAGVRGAGARWQSGAKAGETNYAAGVNDAIARGAFGKGVDKAGAGHYESQAAGIGAQRFPQGIQNGEGRWQEGVQPYLQTLSGLTLTPRAPKGDPRNMQRANEVAQAMRRRKIGG